MSASLLGRAPVVASACFLLVSPWSWPTTSVGDCREMKISQLCSRVKEEGKQLPVRLHHGLDTCLCPFTCTAQDEEETRSPPRSHCPHSMTSCFDHRGDLLSLPSEALTPPEQQLFSPPPGGASVPSPGLSIRAIGLIWQILIALIRAFLNRPD